MDSIQDVNDEICAIYVDIGTTNTRAWLMKGGRMIAQATRPVGVRDTARDGSPQQVRTALRETISELREKAPTCEPVAVVAAGMISSPLGLFELPHLSTPAGFAELSGAAHWCQFPDLTNLPLLLVPGVRCGPVNPDVDTVHDSDVMRGEETLCAGLVILGLVSLPALVLTLGSHWKAIRVDSEGRIASSTTSVSGELIHATQTQTILASAVPKDRPCAVAGHWMDAGMKEQRRSGLSRALFCVRMLELSKQGSPEDRLAFLIGAFIAADLDALISRGWLEPKTLNANVAIVGTPAMSGAWQNALAHLKIPSTLISVAEAEAALLTGLRRILSHSLRTAAREDLRIPQAQG